MNPPPEVEIAQLKQRCFEAQTAAIEINKMLITTEKALDSACTLLALLKQPLREMPGNLAYENRASVAEGCLKLIDQFLEAHPTAHEES